MDIIIMDAWDQVNLAALNLVNKGAGVVKFGLSSLTGKCSCCYYFTLEKGFLDTVPTPHLEKQIM